MLISMSFTGDVDLNQSSIIYYQAILVECTDCALNRFKIDKKEINTQEAVQFIA